MPPPLPSKTCVTFAAAVALLFSLAATHVRAEKLERDARGLLAVGLSENLAPTSDGLGFELIRGRRVEDDGPAAGYSYQPNEETLNGKTLIRKQLEVVDPRALETYLLIGGTGEFAASINGTPQTLDFRGKATTVFQEYRLTGEALRPGLNEIVISGTGKLAVARDDERPPGDSPPPNRSAKSVDGGKTWEDARLGKKDDFDGEYYVRLYLDQHRSQGTLTLPVVDRLNLTEKPLAPPTTECGPLGVRVDLADPGVGRVAIAIRRGKTFVPSDNSWSKWEPLATQTAGNTLAATLPPTAERYLQLRVQLTTDDPRRSPQVRGLALTDESAPAATPVGGEWAKQLTVVQDPATRLIRSSLPFMFESPDHPKLKQLRERYRIDEVVAGAKTEWEKITRLAAWSGVQWSKRTGHLKDIYPKWDALAILTKHDDGTPIGGFCQHYNLVFLQACESLGIRGRPVSLGPGRYSDRIRSGHEVVEIWSNDYRKWVHVDGDAARYYVDAKSRTPLSLRELHDRQLADFNGKPYDPVEAVILADTRPAWTGFNDTPPFIELRMIPRSNFLEQPDPVPLNQGMRSWSWPGHYVWTDTIAPPARLYDLRVSVANNWDWTLNTTEMHLTATDRAGDVQVDLDTVTPGFTGYEAFFDDAGPVPVEDRFVWSLHPGKNRLTVAARNETKALIPTVAVIEWKP